MNEEYFFIQLRDCFTAGYTMPQFCLDNGIKKPLFVAKDASAISFLWQIYAQFDFSKSVKPEFRLLTGNNQEIRFSPGTLFDKMDIKILQDSDLENCDKIFFLATVRLNIKLDKIIYLDELLNYFIRHTYIEIPLLNFLQRNPHVKLFLTNFTVLGDNPNNTEYEKKLIAEGRQYKIAKMTEALEKKEPIKTPYDVFGYSREDLIDILKLTQVKTNLDGSTVLEDSDKPLVQVHNGRRVVPNQPDKFINRIYFLGGCSHFGTGAPFNKTIPSYLQQMLNENNLSYRVENVSQFFTYRYQDILYNLETLPFKNGDIVFIFFDNFLSNVIPSFDVSRTFVRPHNYGEVFVDFAHVNELGYKALAEKFFEFLTKYNFFQNLKFNYPAPPPPPHRYGIPKENFFGTSNLASNKDLQAYKENLRTKRLPIGAIVMNCNPFTLGHKALIEYAAARVKKLYIFVVEEDKSEFKFDDRLKLVKAGVKNISNVEVLPSGKFIISQQTFSGYFNKAELQNVAVDSTQDVEIFAREIAPVLGINIRFAGAEPEDTVTRQYNENMKNILPRYGIDFCEIPRKEFNGEVISAKSVRAALKVGDFEKIKKLVPKTTLKFLIENYSTPPPHCRLTKIKLLLILIKSAQKLGSYCNVKL